MHRAGIPKIPKALANYNFIGYMQRFLPEENVTWLDNRMSFLYGIGYVLHRGSAKETFDGRERGTTRSSRT